MSWLFCHIGAQNDFKKGLNTDRKLLYQYGDPRFNIIAGGNKNTCLAGEQNSDKRGFIVCGLGIVPDKRKIMTPEDWQNRIHENLDLSYTDGHFVVIQWDNKSIIVTTDSLGLRDIYFYMTEHEIVLSTDIFRLKQYTKLEIDFMVFGSRWLLFNQLAPESLFKNIRRLTAGCQIIIQKSDLKVKESKSYFVPESDMPFTDDFFHDTLSSIVELPVHNNRSLSLSLSGGMDSRVLLSCLLNLDSEKWDVHTFGPESNPDRRVVYRIVRDMGLRHHYIDFPLLDKDALIDSLRKYVRFSLVSSPASEIVQLNNYSYFLDKDVVIIDGGFGEVWRREFLNRLAFKGAADLEQLNFKQMIRYLSLDKGNIFTEDIHEQMTNGSINQLDELVSHFPDMQSIGKGNWLDLLALKTRLVNLYAHEQTRLDQHFQCYMPFIQVTLLKYLFSVPVSRRKNAGIYRTLLKRKNKKLTIYPLAKGVCMYPFQLTSFQSRAWSLMMKQLKQTYSNNNALNLLNRLSDFVQDSINSREVRECPYYNYDYISQISHDFYYGDHKYTNELDWFLSFEMMRQSIR